MDRVGSSSVCEIDIDNGYIISINPGFVHYTINTFMKTTRMIPFTSETNFSHNYNSKSHTNKITPRKVFYASLTATDHPRASVSEKIEKDLILINIKINQPLLLIHEQGCRKKNRKGFDNN
jgi:hypothetical protein